MALPFRPGKFGIIAPASNRDTTTLWPRMLRAVLTISTMLLAGVVAWVWLMPVTYFQQSSLTDPYRQFEAVGRAEAGCWLLRVLGPVGLLLLIFGWRRAPRIAFLLQIGWIGLLNATRQTTSAGQLRPVATGIVRILLVGWLAWAGWQWVGATDRRLTEWPYYRFRTGDDVLPNISDSNRDVIRYLSQATPPDARILVASDQKLFFLSYYLLPRRIYHRLHPESEFVIPLAHQERRLSAYRLSELDPEWIRQLHPDFILEYFEHPAYVDTARVLDDPAWIEFFRAAHRDPKLKPGYYVRLRPYRPEPPR